MGKLNKSIIKPGTSIFIGEWLEDNSNVALLLENPVRTLNTDSFLEIPEIILKVEKYLDEGFYAAGYLTYEASEAFGLPVIKNSSTKPLAWFSIYESIQKIPIKDLFLVAGASLLTKTKGKSISNGGHRCPPFKLPSDHPGIVPHSDRIGVVPLCVNFTKNKYLQTIENIKKLISSGDTYQVNFTCRTRFESEVDPELFFLSLYNSHPVPFGAYLNSGEHKILSLSPELFIRKTGDIIESKPMKGTIKRGFSLEDDEKMSEELRNSPKNRAENIMIVDMMRNDFGRICEFGSVETPDVFSIETYRSLHQMTSKVKGKLKPNSSLLDILSAVFPASSITGAPKKRTMEIIKEYEKEPREIYTGTLGFFPPNKDFTLNVAIRTLEYYEGKYKLGVGAGIVADSDPQSEYDETLLKTQFISQAEFDLIETILLDENGNYVYLDEHLERLKNSALYWQYPFSREKIKDTLSVTHRGTTPVRSGGYRCPPYILKIALDSKGNISISTRDYEKVSNPVKIKLSSVRMNSSGRFLYHKTSLRDVYESELSLAKGEDFYEVIFANEKGYITEGSFTNIFYRINGEWYTPPISDGLLCGIWRDKFIKGNNALEKSLKIEDLCKCDEIIIGNSVRGEIKVENITNSEGKFY